MGRLPCCDKHGLKKGTWTSEEDRKLFTYIQENGHGSWRSLPAKAGLQRCGKSCRLRWTNYLRPGIKRGQFSSEEEKTVMQLHALVGNRWSSIAAHLPKRTDNEIKNYWNTHLKKRLIKMGIDPTTHKPKNSNTLSSSQLKRAANLSHMAQWETARLEAEARLGRGDSKLVMSISLPFHNKPNPAIFPPLPCLDILKVWQGTWATNASTISSDFSPTSTLNFIDNMLANHPSATKSAFATNSQPLMSYYDNSKVTEEHKRLNDDDLKCIIKQNDQHFDEFHDPLFMEDIALSALPDHGNENDAKYWNSILDDSATSFACADDKYPGRRGE